MRQLLFIFSVLLLVWTCVQSINVTDAACGKKGRSLASLNMARESIAKAKEMYPNCSDPLSNPNKTGCEIKDKSFGYLDVALNLISFALENYPKCVDIADEKPIPEVKNKTVKHEYPMDCSQVLENGHNVSGIYTIWLSADSALRSLQVFCDMDTSGGGWTVIQRRGKFAVAEDFFRDWATYKKGFGNITAEFWLGNDNIFALTNQSSYSVRFDLVDSKGVKGYALYRTFKVMEESANYKLHIAGYSGDVGDAMTETHNGKQFSTKDRKNENGCGSQDCPADMKGGWWYGNGGGYCCYGANPNGQFLPEGSTNTITWIKWRNYNTLKAVEIKLRRT